MKDQKGDRSCSVNFVRKKESQLTQEGVHPNIDPFEHLCIETLLDIETGLMEGNADFTRKQEKTVSGEQGQDSNEAKPQMHVNFLRQRKMLNMTLITKSCIANSGGFGKLILRTLLSE